MNLSKEFEGDMADEYTRGQMDISEHKKTFDAVMNVSVYSSLLIGLVVIYLTLVFAAGGDWFMSLIITAVVGGIGGFFTKQGVLYWTSLGVLAVIALVAGVIISVLA
ncbi:MAG: aa3-type cytochrome c oxidase subunit IV [Oceanicaulis sp.]